MKTCLRLCAALAVLLLFTLPAHAQVPTADAGPDLNAYVGDLVTLNGSGTDPFGLPLTFSWSFLAWPGASAPVLSASLSPTTSFTPTLEGDYILALVVTDTAGLRSPPDGARVVVSVWLPPVASATADRTAGDAPLMVCFDGSASYSPQPTGVPLSFAWSFGDGATDTTTGAKPCHIYTTASVNPYVPSLVVTDSRGVPSPADTVAAITVTAANHPPIVSPTATPNNGPAPLPVQFAANASDPDGDALTYAWAFGDGGTSTIADPAHTYATGDYVAWLTVTDSHGASVSVSLTISAGTHSCLTVRFASVKWVKPGLSGKVTLWAEFTPTKLAPTDPVEVAFDHTDLLFVPFSAFVRDRFTGTYWYNGGGGLLVNLDLRHGRLYLMTGTVPLALVTFGDGVDVGVALGNEIAAQTIRFKPVMPMMWVFMRPGVLGDPGDNWNR
jgi:PKD repeat protein